MLSQEEMVGVQCGGVLGDKEEVSGLGLIATSCNGVQEGPPCVSHQ